MSDAAGRRFTVAVCEDEPLARLHLRELIEGVSELRWLGEATDGAAAVTLLQESAPDLVFLDIRMPELDGLEVLRRVSAPPAVVFTTAYDEHAVQAFELGAVDYLLKPFGKERFDLAVSRVLRTLRGGGAPTSDQVPAPAERLAAAAPLTRLFARERGRIIPIAVPAIERLEADGDYVAVHTAGRRYLLTVTMNALLERLDARKFVRIHRSHAVNLDFVAALAPFDAGRLSVELRDGTQLTASRSGTQQLRALTF